MAKLSAQGKELARAEIGNVVYALFENRRILQKYRYENGQCSGWSRYARVKTDVDLLDHWRRFIEALKLREEKR